MKLSGIFPPLTTPFGSDGAVNLAGLRENIGLYNRTRLAGYVLNGSTGESVLLRWSEIEEMWAVAREVAAPGKLMIAGTGAESTAETIEHTNGAAAAGYDAALVRTPHYYKSQMTADALADYYRRVADASKIPIMVYSVPIFTGLTVEAPVIARLVEHSNIIGIKDSSGSVERISEFRAVVPEGFQILVGGASTLHEALVRGAVGGILALACALPELCIEVWEATLAGDTVRARAAQERLLAPSTMLGSKYGIPGLKYALDRLGYFGGHPRLPLQPVSDGAKREIDAVLTSVTPAASARQS
jgi:4-hydroxy-2-oxoglutarate aldolase